jgi:hypothetical protein
MFTGKRGLSMFGKKAAYLFAGKVLYSWWQNRAIRRENAGRFMDTKETK